MVMITSAQHEHAQSTKVKTHAPTNDSCWAGPCLRRMIARTVIDKSCGVAWPEQRLLQRYLPVGPATSHRTQSLHRTMPHTAQG